MKLESDKLGFLPTLSTLMGSKDIFHKYVKLELESNQLRVLASNGIYSVKAELGELKGEDFSYCLQSKPLGGLVNRVESVTLKRSKNTVTVSADKTQLKLPLGDSSISQKIFLPNLEGKDSQPLVTVALADIRSATELVGYATLPIKALDNNPTKAPLTCVKLKHWPEGFEYQATTGEFVVRASSSLSADQMDSHKKGIVQPDQDLMIPDQDLKAILNLFNYFGFRDISLQIYGNLQTISAKQDGVALTVISPGISGAYPDFDLLMPKPETLKWVGVNRKEFETKVKMFSEAIPSESRRLLELNLNGSCGLRGFEESNISEISDDLEWSHDLPEGLNGLTVRFSLDQIALLVNKAPKAETLSLGLTSAKTPVVLKLDSPNYWESLIMPIHSVRN